MGFDIGDTAASYLSAAWLPLRTCSARTVPRSPMPLSAHLEELLTDKPHLGHINRFETSVFVPFTRITGVYQLR